MKKISVLLCILIVVMLLAACGKESLPEPTEQPVPVEETAEPTVEPQPAQEEPVEEEPEAEVDSEMKAVAESFIDKDVSELIEAIGEPEATDYAPSCLGPGEDGELDYNGFVVYTYKEGNTEVVKEVV